jgi:hypothetical protein
MAGIGHRARSGVGPERGWQAIELGNYVLPISTRPTASSTVSPAQSSRMYIGLCTPTQE